MLKQLNNDFYNISNRLKQIDSKYTLFFDTNSKLYLVYEIKRGKKLFLFTIGPKLDCRALKRAVETSYKNFKTILKNIEKTNKRIEEKNNNHLTEYSKDMFNAYLNYADLKGGNVNFKGANSFKWV